MLLFVYNTGELWQSSQIDDIAHATVFLHLLLNSTKFILRPNGKHLYIVCRAP